MAINVATTGPANIYWGTPFATMQIQDAAFKVFATSSFLPLGVSSEGVTFKIEEMTKAIDTDELTGKEVILLGVKGTLSASLVAFDENSSKFFNNLGTQARTYSPTGAGSFQVLPGTPKNRALLYHAIKIDIPGESPFHTTRVPGVHSVVFPKCHLSGSTSMVLGTRSKKIQLEWTVFTWSPPTGVYPPGKPKAPLLYYTLP